MRVEVSQLRHRLGSLELFDGVSLALASGKALAVTGPSGGGKSTLLHILAGLMPPLSGSLLWDEVEPYRLSRRRREALRLGQIGLLHQNPHLHPRLDVRANIMLAATFRPVHDAAQRAEELLAAAGLEACAGVRGAAISGGQLIRCALARALLTRPRLLIADEPTATLDGASAAAITQLLCDRQRDEGLSLIVATHDPQLTARCDQVLELSA